ncbi:MAG TPA: FecR domain-containing protein [Cyclobacteriaceae bacterium]
MPDSRLKILFQRYIDETCSEHELEELMMLIRKSSSEDEVKLLMDEVWSDLSPEKHQQLTSLQSDAILNKILPTLNEKIYHTKVQTSFPWFKVAASILLLIVATGIFYYYNHAISPAPTKSLSTTSAQLSSPIEHEYIKLPDGSTVILNNNSTLDYDESFDNKSTRSVTLHGEGYFDIRHDPSKPFIVNTNNLKTTVLGTAFNIKAYSTDHNITVTVLRGKVKVENEKAVIGIITPNEQIIFDTQKYEGYHQIVNGKESVAWTEHDMFFDNVTVEEAVQKLKERFKVNISIDNDQIKTCRFTATFVRGENLDQILSVLCEFNNAQYRRDDNGNIIIKGRGC